MWPSHWEATTEPRNELRSDARASAYTASCELADIAIKMEKALTITHRVVANHVGAFSRRSPNPSSS